MTLYELTKHYGEGKGESTMWATLEIVSEAIEKKMSEEDRHHLLRKLYGAMSGEHYNEDFAAEDVAKMYHTAKDGTKHYAPYWTMQAVRPIYDSIKGEIPGYNACDFYVTLNMVASKQWPIVERWFPNATPQERDQRFVELAVNWLKDPDSKSDGHKIWSYLNGDA